MLVVCLHGLLLGTPSILCVVVQTLTHSCSPNCCNREGGWGGRETETEAQREGGGRGGGEKERGRERERPGGGETDRQK